MDVVWKQQFEKSKKIFATSEKPWFVMDDQDGIVVLDCGTETEGYAWIGEQPNPGIFFVEENRRGKDKFETQILVSETDTAEEGEFKRQGKTLVRLIAKTDRFIVLNDAKPEKAFYWKAWMKNEEKK